MKFEFVQLVDNVRFGGEWDELCKLCTDLLWGFSVRGSGVLAIDAQEEV